jgi:competence protein ComEA
MGMNPPWRELETAEPAQAHAASGRWRPSSLQLTLAGAALLVACSAAAIVYVSSSSGGRVEVVSEPSRQTPGAATPSQATLVVEVAGAVARPGIYTLPVGSRVADAIGAAGGYSTDVDPRAAEAKLNLAARLQDAQLITVPRRGDGAAGSASSTAGQGTSAAATGPINLNTASATDLDTLPGIGPATATKIIASREEKPFASVDDLVSRKIVTPAILAKFRSQVTV